MTKEIVAKLIRIITVPPLMVTAMLLTLYFNKRELFDQGAYILVMISLLGIFPVLAYPMQKLIPKLNNEGREGQRKLAFIMSVIGYTTAFVWAFVCEAGKDVLLICSTYFLSVVILAICNLLHFKASGHACSITGPLLFLLYFMGGKFIIPIVIIASAVIWSSLTLKRHTLPQLIGGIIACILAFTISIITSS